MTDQDPETTREQKVRAVQRHWFNKQPEEKKAEIIKPHFEEAHPTPEEIRKAVTDYEEYP
jgi:hypothetical protein